MFGHHKDYFSRKYRRRTHCMTLLCYMALMSAFRYGEDLGREDFKHPSQDFRYREYRPFAPYTETIGSDAVRITWLPVSRRENLDGYYELYTGYELEYKGQDLIHTARRLHSDREYVFRLRVCSYSSVHCSAFSIPRYHLIQQTRAATVTTKMYSLKMSLESYALILFVLSSILFAGCMIRYIISFFNEVAATIEAIPSTIYQRNMWKNKPKSNKSSTLPVTSDGELDYFVSDSICEKEPLKKIFVKQNITVNSNPLNSARNLNASLLNSSRELQIENGVTSCETEVEQFKKKKRRVRSKTVSISKLTESPTNLSTKMEKCNSDSEICKQRSKSTMDTPVLSTAELSDIVVVVDNSNIFIGARETVSICNPDIRPRHVKLKITQLLQLIEDGRKVTRAMVGASSPFNTTEHVWDIYRRAGYKVDIEERRGRDEQRVDEQLHLAIYKALIELPPQVLVIASGDGHKGKSKSSTSFVQCAKRAIEHGWTVEVLSWKHCLSSEWLKLVATSDRVFVRYLDTHLAKLTAIERRQ